MLPERRRRGQLLALIVLAVVSLTCAPSALGAPASRRPVTLAGLVQLVHVDGVDARSPGQMALVLRTPGGLVALDPGATSLHAGTYVRLVGRRVGGHLLVTAAHVTTAPLAARRAFAADQPASAPSTPRLAVVMINFSNDTRRPFTADGVAAAVFSGPASVGAYYAEQSFGKVQLAGTVLGWYTLPAASTGCDYATWANQGRAAAGSALTGYDHVMFLFPTVSSCAWAGLGDLPGPETWINGYLQLRVLAHELGHNLGVHHANALSCSDGVVRTALAGTCTMTEYGDPYSVMGSGSTRQFSAYHKAELGWLAPTGAYTVTASGTYHVAPSELSTDAPQMLRIVRGADALYVDVRQPFGTAFDAFAAGSSPVSGVMIRVAPATFNMTQPALVDATPSTSTYSDAALVPGQSLTDPVTGATITTVDVGPTGATVQVAMPGGASAPTLPGAVVAVRNGAAIDVSWTASTDAGGVASYRVYRNGLRIGVPTGVTFHDPSPPSNVSLVYGVAAVNSAAIEGEIATAAPLSVGDVAPPSAPGVPLLTLSSSFVSVAWAASTDDVAVTGYLVYRDGVSIGTASTTTLLDQTPRAGASHTYTVAATDAAGHLSAASEPSVIDVPDVIPPTMPGGLAGVTSPLPWSVTLTWTASVDNVRVSAYHVYRDGVLIATTPATAWTDVDMPRVGAATYEVGATDAAGFESLRASVVVLAPPPDHLAPLEPSTVRATALAHRKVALRWSRSVDDVRVARYEIVVGGRTIATTARLALTFRVPVRTGTMIVIAVRAVDTSGNRSALKRVRVRIR